MILALALISFSAIAQNPERGEKKGKNNTEMRMQRANFTPEQQATLHTKKMTLELDLTDAQQKEVYNLNLVQAKERQKTREAFKKAKESGTKPTNQERYDKMVARLDNQITIKNKMKSILKSDQYITWESNLKHHNKGRHDRGSREDKGRQEGRRG